MMFNEMLYLVIYLIGFVVTAIVVGPNDAAGRKDIVAQTVSALLWPLIATFFIIISPVFLVHLINMLRKEK